MIVNSLENNNWKLNTNKNLIKIQNYNNIEQ